MTWPHGSCGLESHSGWRRGRDRRCVLEQIDDAHSVHYWPHTVAKADAVLGGRMTYRVGRKGAVSRVRARRPLWMKDRHLSDAAVASANRAKRNPSLECCLAWKAAVRLRADPHLRSQQKPLKAILRTSTGELRRAD